MRTCNKCSAEKPLVEGFHIDGKGRDGRASICKTCRIAANVTRLRANPEKSRANSAKWRERHLEAARAKSNEWSKAHPEANKRWKTANPEAVKAHFHKRRALKMAFDGQHYTATDVAALVTDQHGLCAYCGQPMKAYHVDHIQPLSRGGGNGADNICLACPPCNSSKGNKTLLEWMLRRGAA